MPPGYKQTEVGVIPEEWEVKTLSAVSSMKSGEGITASRIDEHAQYPCYGGNQDVVSDAFTQDTESVVIRSS